MHRKFKNIKFDFAKADPVIAVQACKQFMALAQKYPKTLSRIARVATVPPTEGLEYFKSNDSMYAFHDTDWDGNDIIALNPKYFGNPAEIKANLVKDQATKFHPDGCDTVESLITHEFGHVLKSAFSDITDSDEIGNFLRKEHPTQALSVYATRNDSEGFAEAFSALTHGSDKAKSDPYVVKLGKLLDKFKDSL
jgi:hypothetical protein